jgi:hypothetical protein
LNGTETNHNLNPAYGLHGLQKSARGQGNRAPQCLRPGDPEVAVRHVGQLFY